MVFRPTRNRNRFTQPFAIRDGPTQDYAGYITALNPALWLRMRETSGSTASNSGSAGSALNGTMTNVTLGQTGQLGANEAFDFASATNRIAVPNDATLQAATVTFTLAALIKPDSAGGGSQGRVIEYPGRMVLLFNSAITSWLMQITGSSGANTTTTAGLATGAWNWLFVTYDNTGDRKARLYRVSSNAITEYGYSAQPAVSGTLGTPSTTLYVGNRATLDRAWDGMDDELIITGSILSTTQMADIARLSGVIT